jgi:hypothetical protein
MSLIRISDDESDGFGDFVTHSSFLNNVESDDSEFGDFVSSMTDIPTNAIKTRNSNLKHYYCTPSKPKPTLDLQQKSLWTEILLTCYNELNRCADVVDKVNTVLKDNQKERIYLLRNHSKVMAYFKAIKQIYFVTTRIKASYEKFNHDENLMKTFGKIQTAVLRIRSYVSDEEIQDSVGDTCCRVCLASPDHPVYWKGNTYHPQCINLCIHRNIKLDH